MNPSDLTSRRRVLIAVIAAAVVLLVIVGVGAYGLIRGPQPTGPSGDDAVTLAPGPTGPSGTSATPRPLYDTTDAEAFARSVAVSLFTWDTTGSHGPSDYAQVLVDVGDPTGTETSGLASDVRSYLPATDAWAQLRTHQTKQWITIETVEIPDAWADAETQAAPGQLLPGTTAYTITGTRHRAGIWGTEPMQTERPVSFTVFIACEPSFDACRLLRLSQVDNPLR
ncbi:hypothetical protein [Sediminivirga luteola]|uniref:Uncharacterized protein n=1 Tax=Sediminivirga luteola TaxID=1774748 RepID=A0A8J2XKN3_9MICO|nr:hypothetical protein [Sediminivirga luteola]GGA15752.1 hypothetical protein GCM10011333_18430 [Sediminivirga luteola]